MPKADPDMNNPYKHQTYTAGAQGKKYKVGSALPGGQKKKRSGFFAALQGVSTPAYVRDQYSSRRKGRGE